MSLASASFSECCTVSEILLDFFFYLCQLAPEVMYSGCVRTLEWWQNGAAHSVWAIIPSFVLYVTKIWGNNHHSKIHTVLLCFPVKFAKWGRGEVLWTCGIFTVPASMLAMSRSSMVAVWYITHDLSAYNMQCLAWCPYMATSIQFPGNGELFSCSPV